MSLIRLHEPVRYTPDHTHASEAVLSGAHLAERSSAAGLPAHCPPAPRTLEDTGLPFLFVAQLVCKIFYRCGAQRLSDLAARVRLPSTVLAPVIDFLRRDKMCEVASSSTASNLVFGLTDLGRSRSEEYLRLCQYAGAAPVSLDAYLAQVERQTIGQLAVSRDDMRAAFDGIVIREETLEQFGAAMNSGRAIFVYGPAGSGKTFTAGKLARLLAGDVYVPHAILVENQVVQVFDPLSHQRVQALQADPIAITSDQRWVRCRRPVVVAGGELTLAMLDLRFDEGSRYYAAPPQLKANNGLFIVDDLGRQLVQAKDLMNRWIVPLDRRIDYLSLHTGEKFMVPFDVTVIFCTNLAPAELADAAFLRRLGYKIHLGALEEVQYRAVCAQVCAALGIPHSEAAVDHLIARFRHEGRPLLACTPRDLLKQVQDRARYQGMPPQLTVELLDWAWNNYFAPERID